MSLSIFRERSRARKERVEKRLQRDNFPEGDRPVMRASNIHYELADRTLATNYGGIGLMYQLARESGLIDAAMSNRVNHDTGAPANDGRKLYIAFDEWNVWYRARGDSQRGRRILEEHYNLEDALVVAGFLNSLVNHADVVKIANLAQLVNVIAPIFTGDQGLFLQTIYYPLQLFSTHVKGNSLELLVDGPSYKSKRFDKVPYLGARHRTSERRNGSGIDNSSPRIVGRGGGLIEPRGHGAEIDLVEHQRDRNPGRQLLELQG